MESRERLRRRARRNDILADNIDRDGQAYRAIDDQIHGLPKIAVRCKGPALYPRLIDGVDGAGRSATGQKIEYFLQDIILACIRPNLARATQGCKRRQASIDA
ncbi:hypothetical protein GCM10011342_18210 [Aquisalinus flavus]|uniref:Uncharacterized protein n=1 Tax=Aquisalinus flavus TaxID=1526572 RepID=A0A8J2Y711_9PROT|nr:hypothetical protein GCM10011342_18210 [Aquisalinus flavus]